MKLYLFAKVIVLAALLTFGSNTSAQTPETSSQKRKIYVGIKDAAYPISSWNNKQPSGYCATFFKALEKKKNLVVEFKRVEVRFQGTSDDNTKLDAECGPNTITDVRVKQVLKSKQKNAKFSEPFAVTGTKLLIKNGKIENFNNLSKKSDEILRIGSPHSDLEPTTTYNIISWSYASEIALRRIEIEKLDREGAIEKLKKNEISAYANDGILLQGILNQHKDLKESSIIPQYDSLSRELYGIVVYRSELNDGRIADNQQLLDDINEFIGNSRFEEFEEIKIAVPDDNSFKEMEGFRQRSILDRTLQSVRKGDNLFLNILLLSIAIGTFATLASLFTILVLLVASKKRRQRNDQSIAPELTFKRSVEKTLVICQIYTIVQSLPEEPELKSSESNELRTLLSQLRQIVGNEENLTQEKRNSLMSQVDEFENLIQQPQKEIGQKSIELLKTIASALPDAAKIFESVSSIVKTLGM